MTPANMSFIFVQPNASEIFLIQSLMTLKKQMQHNIAINHRTFGAGLKTATRFFAGYGGRYV